MSLSKYFTLVCCALALLAGTGCRTYEQQRKSMAAQWNNGNYAGAAMEYGKQADQKAGGKDEVIWRLEHAAALRAAGQFKESNDAFNQADAAITRYDNSAKVKLGRETAALTINLAELPYEGRAYDKIMLNSYKALNYLSLGDPDKARVELIRAYQRQQDAVFEYKKKIEKAQEEVSKNKDRAAIKKAENDVGLKSKLNASYQDLDRLKAYGDFVNPFAVFMDALFFMYQSSSGSDLERANKSLERMTVFAAENRYLKQDVETINAMVNGHPIASPTTYVIFETGCAPERDQIRIDIPIIVTTVSYVGASFPKLVFRGNAPSTLNVSGSGFTESTAPMCSMDSVVANDFKNELPTIITKTIASTVVKGAMNYAANEAAKQGGDILAIAVKIGTVVADASRNIADLRTWTSLPKEFQYCRFPTPSDRKVLLSTPNGQRRDVSLIEGKVNVVYVKCVSGNAPLAISQFKLQ